MKVNADKVRIYFQKQNISILNIKISDKLIKFYYTLIYIDESE